MKCKNTNFAAGQNNVFMKGIVGRESVDKSYFQKLNTREKLLTEQIAKREKVHPVLVTTYGLKYNEYSGVFQRVVIMDALFY